MAMRFMRQTLHHGGHEDTRQSGLNLVSSCPRDRHISARCSKAARRRVTRQCDRGCRRGRESAPNYPSRRRFVSTSTRTSRRQCPAITIATPRPRVQRPARRQPPRADRGEKNRAEDEPADGAFNRFLRADGRGQRVSAKRPAGVVLRAVAHEDREHHQKQHLRPAQFANGDHRAERKAQIEQRQRRCRRRRHRVGPRTPRRRARTRRSRETTPAARHRARSRAASSRPGA